MSGTLALSWGPSGGFYVHPHRICIGRVALTYVPDAEIDDLMLAYVERAEASTTQSASAAPRT